MADESTVEWLKAQRAKVLAERFELSTLPPTDDMDTKALRTAHKAALTRRVNHLDEMIEEAEGGE